MRSMLLATFHWTSFVLFSIMSISTGSTSTLARQVSISRRGYFIPYWVCYIIWRFWRTNTSVNSSCAHPPPPNCGAFACLVSPMGGALANLAWPGGRAFAYPRAFDTHGVSDSKSKHGGFYCKGPAVCRRLDRPLRTGQTCGGFLNFMHFFIAHQGTTITLYSEIGTDQRELTNACFFEQGFKQNLIAMILKLLRSIVEF